MGREPPETQEIYGFIVDFEKNVWIRLENDPFPNILRRNGTTNILYCFKNCQFSGWSQIRPCEKLVVVSFIQKEIATSLHTESCFWKWTSWWLGYGASHCVQETWVPGVSSHSEKPHETEESGELGTW